MKVVIDAVIFVRALMNSRNPCGQLLARTDEFTTLISFEIVDEILGVARRPELKRKFTRMSGLPELQALLSVLALAEGVMPVDKPPVSRDPKDDKYFWCAAAGNADYIISEDEDILAIAEYKGTRTVRATEFLRFLDATKS